MVGAETLVSALSGAVSQTWTYVPYLIITIVILVIGLVVGKIVGRVVKEILEKIKLDYYVTEEKKPSVSLAGIVSVISRWYIYLAFIGMAFGLQDGGAFVYPDINSWTSNIFTYLPAVIGAAVVMIAGYLIAEYIKNMMSKSGKPYSILTGKIILFFTLFVSLAIALSILFAPLAYTQPLAFTQYTNLVTYVLLIIIIAVAAAVALSVGLGGREVVGAMMKKWAKKSKYI